MDNLWSSSLPSTIKSRTLKYNPILNHSKWKNKFINNCLLHISNKRDKIIADIRSKYDNDDDLKRRLEDIVNIELEELNGVEEALTEEEYEELLILMQEKLLSKNIEKTADEFMYNMLGDLYSQIAKHDPDNPLVICPICQSKYINVSDFIFMCTCDFKLDLQDPSISLNELKCSLELNVSEHGNSCFSNPSFTVLSNYGKDSLYLICEDCESFKLVI